MIKFCHGCGEKVKEKSKFCPSCGSEIGYESAEKTKSKLAKKHHRIGRTFRTIALIILIIIVFTGCFAYFGVLNPSRLELTPEQVGIIKYADIIQDYNRHIDDLNSINGRLNTHLENYNNVIGQQQADINSIIKASQEFANDFKLFRQKSQTFREFTRTYEKELKEANVNTYDNIKWLDESLVWGEGVAEHMAETIQSVETQQKAQQDMIVNIAKLLLGGI